MNQIYLVLIATLLTLGLFSCEDSLGVNGTDYIKEMISGDTISVDTTMINYKKVVIREIVAKRDTIYDTSYVKQPIVTSGKSYLQIFQRHGQGGDIRELTSEFDQFSYNSTLDYNYLTPKLDLILSVTTNHDLQVVKNKGFPGVIRYGYIKIPEMFIISDQPIPLAELKKLGGNFKLTFTTTDYVNFDYEADKINGIFGVSKRVVEEGEIKSVTLYFQGEVIDFNNPAKRFAFSFHLRIDF
ncbi:MAG: hypothetical protein KGZ71_14290 [Desulfobulbaceae bacterium]|nr:hypothetical protein [Desulfobulbaceae bacterium]